jgi:hypothetical protein
VSRDYAENHPGYSFTDPSGREVHVPPAKVTDAATYVHEPMTREQASDVLIAFGLVTNGDIPIRCKANGAGFDAVVPLEFIRELPMVRAYLEGKRWI